jgi:hypothetical protein
MYWVGKWRLSARRMFAISGDYLCKYRHGADSFENKNGTYRLFLEFTAPPIRWHGMFLMPFQRAESKWS